MAQTSEDRNPTPDLAEDNAFFPHLIRFPNTRPVKLILMAPIILIPILVIKKF